MKIFSILLVGLLVTHAIESIGQPNQADGQRRGPPPEALAACKNTKANAACSFKGRQGEPVKGTCWAPDKSKPLACKPAGHAENGPRMP